MMLRLAVGVLAFVSAGFGIANLVYGNAFNGLVAFTLAMGVIFYLQITAEGEW